MSCYQNSKNNLTQTCTEQDQSRRKGTKKIVGVFASWREKLFCCQCFTSFASPCFWVALIVLILIATSCQVLPEPPRLATATAQAALPPSPTPEPLVIPVDSETAASASSAQTDASDQSSSDGRPNPSLTVWINETSSAHQSAVNEMIEDFSTKNNVNVEVMFVKSNTLPGLVQTAAENGDLPDIILHPIEYTIGWAEQGILSPDAAETAVNNLDPSTFNQAALDLVSIDGKPAAVPSDGYQQLLLYRTDWFAERNLDTPDNYNDMLAAAEAIYDRENLRSGFVIPTESNLRTTHQAFEHIAAANGCELINEAGEVLLTDPACKEALDFYYDIVHQFSPIGVQTDTSTRNAYLAGRTGMIMTPPTILPQLVGLDEENLPTCTECDRNIKHLAENSGIITTIFGRGGTSANFGEMTNLGITNEADPETAVLFTEYWFNDGYETWLAVESERKVPLRQGTSTNSTQYLDNWGQEPLTVSDQSLSDLFGEEVVAQLRDGVAESNRWGIPQGQGALVTDLYRELSLSVVLQEMLSGYFNTDKTIYEAYQRVLEFIPDYTFEVVVQPTPTPEPEE